MLARLLVGSILATVGFWVAILGLMRLGWGSHGASPTDLRFLHLDWIVDPSLPFWRAHIVDLSLLVVGLVAWIAGGVVAVRAAIAHMRSIKSSRSPQA